MFCISILGLSVSPGRQGQSAGKSNHSAGHRRIAVLMFKEAIGSTGAALYGDIHQIHLRPSHRAIALGHALIS
jgi:hypothetical protein